MSLEKLEARDTQADLGQLANRLICEIVTEPNSVQTFTPGHTIVMLNSDQVRELVGRSWMMGARVALNVAGGRAPCRVCGCWELEACDGGCGWAEADLCTACAEAQAWETSV